MCGREWQYQAALNKKKEDTIAAYHQLCLYPRLVSGQIDLMQVSTLRANTRMRNGAHAHTHNTRIHVRAHTNARKSARAHKEGSFCAVP